MSFCGASIYADADAGGSISARGGWPAGVMVQIVDADGTPCVTGAVGELRLHGDRCMTGYIGADSAAVLREGWLYSGDLASVDGCAAIRIVGRAREIIKTAHGEAVYPLEIESVLAHNEFVVEAAVCGTFDPALGECMIAFVITRSNAPESGKLSALLASAIRRSLGPSKVPHRIVICEEFPRVGHGKIDKNKLMALHWENRR